MTRNQGRVTRPAAARAACRLAGLRAAGHACPRPMEGRTVVTTSAPTRKTTTRRGRLRAWGREAAGLAGILLLALTARGTLADHYHVPTGSMQPTVAIGDRILVNKAAYGVRVPLTETWLVHGDEPVPGDVVVLASPEDGDILLKRVVAAPGDAVAVRGGRLWRNGAVVPVGEDGLERLGDVAHPLRLEHGGGPDFGPVLVPSGRFLVMGDNRGDSLDGRVFGWVRREAIFGRAVGVFARDGRPTWQPL